MKKIEIEEYVRTNTGKFDKVINNNYYIPQYIECEKGIVDKENIVKHSKIIIDLVEVGDYINENRVYKITSACIYCVGKAVQNKLTINIETILTKELYQANCYTVERRENGD